MKRKVLSLLLVMTMGISMLVACGGGDAADNGAQGNDTLQEEKEEIDTSIYTEKVELTTEGGKVVTVYYDPTVIQYTEGEDFYGNPTVNLGDMWDVQVYDFATAQEYADATVANANGEIEIGESETVECGGYTVHHFRFNVVEIGAWAGEFDVIELPSGVVFDLGEIPSSVSEWSDAETQLAAIKFVVE